MSIKRQRDNKLSRTVRSASDTKLQSTPLADFADRQANGVAHPLTVMPALQEVRSTLFRVRAVLVTVQFALKGQNDDYDQEFADTLRSGATYQLDHLIVRLSSILGIAPDAEN